MASPSQLTHVTFGGGIDQGVRNELVDPNVSVLNAENCRQPTTGARSKRYGFTALSRDRIDATSRSAGDRLFTDGLVPTVIDGTLIDSYSEDLAVSVAHGRLPEATFRLSDLPTQGKSGSVEDVEYCNGLFAVTSTVSSGSSTYAVVTLVDAASGAIVRGPDLLGVFTQPIVCSYGAYFLVLKCDTATTTISVMYLDTTSAASITTGWVAAGGNVTTTWGALARVSACSLDDRIAIAWGVDSGTDRVAVKTWNIAGQVESTTVPTGSVTPGNVDINGRSSDTLWVAWNETTSVKVRGLTPTAIGTPLATTATIITVSAGGARMHITPSSTAGKARLLVGDVVSSFAASRMRGVQTSGGAAATDGSSQLLAGFSALTRPFQYGGRYYVLGTAGVASLSTTTQNVAVLVDFSEDVTWTRPVCNVEPGLAVAQATMFGKGVAGGSTTKRYLPLNVRRANVGNASQLIELDFASNARWNSVAHGNSTYLDGGVVGYSDGKRFNEASFMHRPPKPTTSTSGTGITLTTGRRYVAVYEAIDADGNLTVSGLSDPSDSTGAVANKTISVVTQPCAMTSRLDSSGPALASSRVVLSATADAAPPPYYRHSVLDNDTSSNVLTFTDTTTDASLTAQAMLYSQPGIPGSSQDHRPPPGLKHLVSYNGMLVGACGRTLYHSSQPILGEAPWFNPLFQLPIDCDGDITGLAAMDGTLYVFARRSIWAVTGEPPSDNGASGGLGTPRRLATNDGCTEPRSIVVTTKGAFFIGDDGLRLLARAQQVAPIGDPVYATVRDFPYCWAATVDSTESVVYFELSSAESSGRASGDGRTLVFDLKHDHWTSIDRRTGGDGVADKPAQSAAMIYTSVGWRYAWLDTAGRVHVEDKTSYLDPGSTWVTATVEFAWFQPAGLQGMMHPNRFLFLGRKVTDADIVIGLAYDYASSYKTGTRWTRATIDTVVGALTGGQLQLEHLAHDEADGAEAIRCFVTDDAPTGGTVGSGAGAVFVGLTLDAQPKPTGYMLPTEAG